MRGIFSAFNSYVRCANGPIAKFVRDENGAVVAYVVLLFLTMVVAAGGAVDFMRHEQMRSKLQDSLDRGLLAAASLSQTVSATQAIQDYIDSSSFTQQYNLNVTVDNTPAARRVSAYVDLDIQTFFLKIIGIPTMTVAAAGAAEQTRQNIEITLVLDISGSMARNNRMDNMIPAAKDFIDQVLTVQNMDYTSISLVPFSGQTNPGNWMFNYFVSGQYHNYANCLEFNASDYNNIDLPTTGNSLTQSRQFQYYFFEQPTAIWGWCPTQSTIIPLSNDAAALKAAIDNFRPSDGTGTQIAMKWGLGLLNPSSRSLVTSMVNAGEIPSAFDGRPSNWNDPDTQKFVVLMSDGNIRAQPRPKWQYYDTSSERSFWATSGNYLGSSYRYTMTSESDAELQFLNVCGQAKTANVTVFAIGFEVTNTAEAELSACASSASHYYYAQGSNIGDAFSSIASTIQKLKLIN